VDSLATTQDNGKGASPPAPATAGVTSMRFRIAIAALWTIVIVALCWTPGHMVQKLEKGSFWYSIPNLDKVVHWGIFVVFALLWLRTSTSRWRYAWVALGGLAAASITEYVQNQPWVGRDGSLDDAITDVIGVAIGLAIAPWIEPLLCRMEPLWFRGLGIGSRPGEVKGDDH
jgi:hypothetical protein